MERDGLSFHNVGELVSKDGDSEGERSEPSERASGESGPASRDGDLIQRVPEDVRTGLNEGAQTRMRHPAGVEIRFVPDGPVSVTLSSDVRDSEVQVFWGPFQDPDPFVVGEDPTTIEVEFPEKLGRIDDDVTEDLEFDPRVCRLRLPGEHRSGHVSYHGVSGDVRPPRDGELPDLTYLAYGTSITEGEAASVEHLTYVSQTAHRLEADLVNLGSCGTAYCDPAMADHIADRDDWDVATLALSVNMVGEFDLETFRERAANMVDAVAGANPEKPVAAVTLYTHYRDICRGRDDADLAAEFRETLRDVVDDCGHDNVHLFEGTDVLDDPRGLAPDLIHPGDDAMVRMGQNLAERLEPLVEGAASSE